eukprot:TRINITY_DN14813_c0_g1_i2.p1 TRINITY_DN14813_c0_g1~~TRINITY_DN14813_c0_g1_i2.p1  ORF type:complete len:410 (+),score=67.33 TRINITY_DN14813_c0_g1_i2:876-2105(+)
MAGSVGGAVVGCPGYAGYIPSSRQPLTSTNSTVTDRMPLISRTRSSQATGTKPSFTATEADIIRDPTGVFMPKRSTETTLYSTQGTFRPDPGDWVQPKTKRALLESQGQGQTSTAGGPKFSAKSLYNETNKMETNRPTNYYSSVQQAEMKGAEEDLTASFKNTRSSARQHQPTAKKQVTRVEAAAGLEAPKFDLPPKRKILGAEPISASEFVKFKGAHESKSSSQKEYGARGYVPAANIAATVEKMSMAATTSDLFAGTAKSALGLRLPGYMGHVPCGDASKGTMKRTKPDLLKQNSQNVRLMSTSRKTLPGYSGFEPKSLENDNGMPNRPATHLTSTGVAGASVLAGETEKAMNNTTHAKQAGIRMFFTQGGGQPDHSISEQYYVKYRPMEGSLKMGARSERTIPVAK